MRAPRALLFSVAALALAGAPLTGVAQDAPEPAPRGPADVINRAREAREASEAERATEPAEAEGASRALPEGHPSVTQEHAARALAEPQIADARPSDDVPAGEIHVRVIEANGDPAAHAPIRLGILGAGGERQSRAAEADAEGEARFRDLPTGSGQAYRVNVTHEGATYSSAPFQLEPDRGHLVRVLRLPVTRDERVLLQWFGGTFMELKPERLHVIQQMELVNLGRETYVFPEEGLRFSLPEGFTAFQSKQVMTDQRFVPDARGFSLQGSLPPGRVQLAWAFDLPLSGETIAFSQRIPVRTYQYVVVTDDVPGLELEVAGFPEAQRTRSTGRPHIVTRIQHDPTDPPWETLRVTLRGVPGPGPLRDVAILLALGFAGLGVYLAVKGGGSSLAAERARELRRRELLDEAASLEEAFARDEIGPKYHERRRREIVDELAVLLRADREGGAKGAAKAPAPARPAAR